MEKLMEDLQWKLISNSILLLLSFYCIWKLFNALGENKDEEKKDALYTAMVYFLISAFINIL